MTAIVLALAAAALVLGIGILIGSGLHTRAVDQRYRQVAQQVREVNEREDMILWLTATPGNRVALHEVPRPRNSDRRPLLNK